MVPFTVIARQATQTGEVVQGTDLPDGFVEENGRIVPFWWSRTGVIIKWSVFLGLLVITALYVTIGNIHAKRRMRKGLAPLAYHRWLVPRAQLARVDPRYAYPQSGYTPYRPNYYNQQYNMQNMPPPPPMYDPSAARPPMYEGPAGATKMAPSQWTQEPTYRPQQTGTTGDDYDAPSGPPPAVTANHTGTSNPFRG